MKKTIKYNFKFIVTMICLTWLAALKPLVSCADQPEITEYIVRCDSQRQQVIVAESNFMPTLDKQGYQKGISEFKVNPATLTKIGGTDRQPLQLPAGRKTFKCQLGRVLYRVVIEPYILNARMMGQCGAADPVISLSVNRDGKQLFSKINFNRCQSGRTIYRIQLSEPMNSIRVLALLDPPVQIEKTFSLTSFPKDWEKVIFEDYPTGDINADLFISVYRRDISAIQRAIKQGANPNANDIMGFPVLALLGNGREAAYRNRTLEEFDHLSDEIAKILFAAGASGKATRNDGITLLDYLIGNVPTTVIDRLLAHGASAREGYPLSRAVGMGDWKLAGKLINAGADTNKKAQDRTVPLYWASVSGFYTRWGQATPPITEYAKCVKLLLQHGAKVRNATHDSTELLVDLINQFGNEERLRIIVAELLPYSDNDSIDRAQKLAAKIANGNETYISLAKWLKQYVR